MVCRCGIEDTPEPVYTHCLVLSLSLFELTVAGLPEISTICKSSDDFLSATVSQVNSHKATMHHNEHSQLIHSL